jgi:hypothetical protein
VIADAEGVVGVSFVAVPRNGKGSARARGKVDQDQDVDDELAS